MWNPYSNSRRSLVKTYIEDLEKNLVQPKRKSTSGSPVRINRLRMNVTYNQNYMFPAFYPLPGYAGYQYPYNVYAMGGVYVPACPEPSTPGVCDPTAPTSPNGVCDPAAPASPHVSPSFSQISSEGQTSPLRNDVKPFDVLDTTARPACVFEDISNHSVSSDCALETMQTDDQRRCSMPSTSPLHQLRLPSITVTSNMAANVMSEECDLGYCSFETELTPLPELKDVADVASLNEILDAQSTFSDIIDDVLDSMDGDSSTLGENSMTSPDLHVSDFQWDLPVTDYSSDECTDYVPQKTSPCDQFQQACENPNLSAVATTQSTNRCLSAKLCPTPVGVGHSFALSHQHKSKQICEKSSVNAVARNKSTHNCGECNKTFENQSNLNAHARLHNKNNLQTFENQSSLITHARLHNNNKNKHHERERPHRCDYCHKSFTQKSTLRTHVRTHTGERPYSCTWCARAFSDYSTYRKHVRVHTGEKPYTCDVCGRSFTQSGNMIRHKQMHDKPRK